MAKRKPFLKQAARTRKPRLAATSREGVPWAVAAPVYAAALGLLAVYASGYLAADLGPLAFGLIGVSAMAELLKPQLGAMAAAAIDGGDAVARWAVGGAALACVLVGAAGGVNAMHIAGVPAERRAVAAAALAQASAAHAEALRMVDSVPACTPEMPATRCARMAAQNATVLAERKARADALALSVERARAGLQALPEAAGLPPLPAWLKGLFTIVIEFLMFAAPFAAMRLRARDGAVKPQAACAPAPEKVISATAEAPPAPPVKVNDGGWPQRRALYGSSGRKPKRFPPRLVAA